MDSDSSEEYVETSDVEEREEIDRIRGRGNATISEGFLAGDLDYYRPSKRAKLFHDSIQLAKLNVLSAHVVAETPAASQNSTTSKDEGTSPTRVDETDVPPVSDEPKTEEEEEDVKSEPGSLIGEVVSDNEMDLGYPDEPEQSQDPLLLYSFPRPETVPTLPVTPKREPGLSTPYVSPNHKRASTTPLVSPLGPFRGAASLSPVTPVAATDEDEKEDADNGAPSDDANDIEGDFQYLFSFDPDVDMTEDVKPSTSPPPISPNTSRRSVSPIAKISVPSSPARSARHSSPLSSLPATPRSLAPPEPESPAAAQQEPIPEIVQQIQEAENRPYRLRKRQAVQLKPYSVDKIIYNQTMKAAPEAIVKIRSPGKHRRQDHPDDHYEEEEESQNVGGETLVVDAEDEEDGTWEERERRRKRARSREASAPQEEPDEVADFLKQLMDDFDSGDDEEEKEMRATARENKRMLKEQEKARKVKEKEEKAKRRKEKEERRRERERIKAQTRAKAAESGSKVNPRDAQRIPAAFPLLGTDSRDNDDTANTLDDSTLENYAVYDLPSDSELPATVFDNAQDDSLPPPVPSPQPLEPLEIPSDDNSEPDGARRLRRAHSVRSSTHLTISDSSSSSSSESDDDDGGKSPLDALPKEGAEILCRMYPPGLAKILLGQGKKKPLPPKRKEWQSSAVVSDGEGDGGVLKPGQTKVRRVIGGPLKEIKGDSESESEEERRPTAVDSTLDDWVSVAPPLRSSSVRYSSPTHRRASSVHSDDDTEPRQRLVTNWRKPKREEEQDDERYPMVHEISSDSEVEEIDTTAISLLLHGGAKPSGKGTRPQNDRPRLENTLIDYMLAGTRVMVDGDRSHRSRGSRGSKSKSGGGGAGRSAAGGRSRGSGGGGGGGGSGGQQKFKLDIVVGGGRGRERQARLHFDGYPKHSRKSSHTSSGQAGGRSSHLPPRPSFTDDESDINRHKVGIDLNEAQKKRARKLKEKERKARIKNNGLYIVSSGGGKSFLTSRHIPPGYRQSSRFITVDVEEEQSGVWAARNGDPGAKIRQWEGPIHRRPRPPDPPPAIRRSVEPPDSDIEILDAGLWEDDEVEEVKPKSEEEEAVFEELLVLKDGGVPFFYSGIAFGPTTYIRKGWLHDLTSVVRRAGEPVTMTPLIVPGFERFDLSHDLNPKRLGEVVERVCEDLFDFATKIPDPDQEMEMEQWILVMRHVSLAITAHLSTPGLNETERVDLFKAVEGHLERLIMRVKSLELPRQSVDVLILHVDWFAVEIGARIGSVVLNPRGELSTSPLADAIKLTFRHILTIGVDKALDAVRKKLDPSEASSVKIFSAELWVRLIHLLSDIGQRQPSTGRKQVPLFWQFILLAFRSMADEKPGNTAIYEKCWKTTFSLCALSQFSVRGMTLNKPRLPACWDVVKLLFEGTLKQLDTDSDEQERYLGYILSRCLILQERWQWKIADVSIIVKQVVDKVFAPRKFANLGTEKPEFPAFLRQSTPDTISVFEDSDPAYTLLLKFIVKAAKDGSDERSKGLSAGVRKLVSLSEPVSTVTFANGKHPDVGELSMLVNRITAAIIAVYLDPSVCESKVNQLRKAMPFHKVDNQVRCILIRGVMYWTLFLTRCQPEVKLDALANWAGEMALVLSQKYQNARKSENQADNKMVKITLLSSMLLEVVSRIVLARKEASRYPEVSFLANLKPLILVVSRENVELKYTMQKLMKVYIDSRYSVIPPERPPLPALPTAEDEQEEESQDQFGDMFGFDEIDWSNVDLPAELAAPAPVIPFKEEDAALKQAMADTGLNWFIFRCFKESAENPLATPQSLSNVLELIQCYIGCRLLGLDGTEKDWNEILQLLDKVVTEIRAQSELQARKIDMMISLASLQRCPKAYIIPSLGSRFFQVFLYTLVDIPRPEPRIDARFVAEIVSLDQLQHPLLRNCNCLPPSDPVTKLYAFDAEQFLQFRVPLIDVIFHNLESIMVQTAPETKVDEVTPLKYMLSAMRNTFMSLHGRTQSDYAIFCRQVMDKFKQCEHLSQQKEFEFWTTWTP